MSAQAFQPMLQNLQSEHGFVPLRLEGTLPAELHGTLYRNGPGIFELFGQRYKHLFDGDGAVVACQLDAGSCRGAARIVQSAGLRQERAVGRPLFDSFGTRRAGLWRTLRGQHGKNVANTSVMFWQGRLLALMEGGLPTELNPKTLETLGETDLDGAVLRTFSAHPHRVPTRRCSYNFGVRYGRNTFLDLVVLPDDGPPRHLTSVQMSRRSFVHDFIVTPQYAVFFVPPLELQLLSYYLRGKPFSECLRWLPQLGTEVIVVDFDAPHRVRRFTTDAFFQYHFANACSLGDELLVDFVRYDDYTHDATLKTIESSQGNKGLKTSYVRATINPSALRVTLATLNAGQTIEFPRVNPAHDAAPHRYTYLATYGDTAAGAAGLAVGLGVLDTTTGNLQAINCGPEVYPSEPIFVPRAGATMEKDGYLLSVIFDPAHGNSFLAVFDPQKPDNGPICRAHFAQPLPTSFHGTFAPQV